MLTYGGTQLYPSRCMGGVHKAHRGLVYILCFGCMNTDKLKRFSIGSGLGYIGEIFRPLWILRKGTTTRTVRLRIYALESSTDGLKHALRLVPISRLQPCDKTCAVRVTNDTVRRHATCC